MADALDRAAVWLVRDAWRRRPRLSLAVYLGCIGVGAAVAAHGPIWIGLVASAAVWIVFSASVRPLYRRYAALEARRSAAAQDGDVATMTALRALLDGPGAAKSPREALARRIRASDELLVREDWAGARAVLEAIDVAALPAASRPMFENNWAYATAQSGEPDAAIPIAEGALRRAEKLGRLAPQQLDYLRGTLAIARSLAGQHEEAIDALEPLSRADAAPRATAARAFFLARSLGALGRTDDACAAYARAAAASGPWAERARAALAALSPHR